MFNQFGPFHLFNFTDTDFSVAFDALTQLSEQGKGSKAKSWKIYYKFHENLSLLVPWVHSNIKEISEVFPLTKGGKIYKNRHLLVKQYEEAKTSSPQGLGSRGFEGTNYRIVVRSDNKRKLACYYGEFLNLSGFPLNYRDSYPQNSICEICGNHKSVGICTICGRWYCENCNVDCEECRNHFCTTCDTKHGVLSYSAHEWYFHRK